MAFIRKTREDIRPKEVHQLFLGALEAHPRLPLPTLLMAVLPVGQHPQLLASFGIGDNPSALSNACPVCSARDFAWCASTSSTISEMVWSRCNIFSFQGWPMTPSLHTSMLHTYARRSVK